MSTPAITRIRRTIAANGLAVLISTTALTTLGRLVSNLVLTRLLVPEAFGIVGVISAVMTVMQLITDMGFRAFVVRINDTIDHHFLSVVWTLRLLRSVFLTAAMFLGADILAAAFDKPDLAEPLRAASFIFLLEGVTTLHPFVALRQQRVSFITSLEFAAFLVQTIVAIAASLLLRSFWGIIIGMYAGNIAKALFSYTLYGGTPHAFSFDRRISRELWNFARLVIVSSMITLLLGQADKVFIGRALSLDMLGLYMLAVSFVGAATNLVDAYNQKILFPLFSETFRKAPQTLDALYYSSRRRLTLALAFLLGGGIGGGQLVIRILLDDRYLDAGLYLSILCLGPLFLLLTKPAESLMFARGRIRATLEGNVARLVWIAVAAPLAYFFYGVLGLIFAFALIEAAASLYWSFRLHRHQIWRPGEDLLVLGAAAAGAALGFGADSLANALIARGVLPSF